MATRDMAAIITTAVEEMKKGGFNCMPIPENRDKEYQFETELMEVVEEAGFKLKWINTFKGGCWHVVPKGE